MTTYGKKYRVGEWLKVKDPKTDEPAVRNPFQGSRVPRETQKSGQDPNDEDSAFQDWTIQNLQARGVQFLCCHTATEEQSRALIHLQPDVTAQIQGAADIVAVLQGDGTAPLPRQ